MEEVILVDINDNPVGTMEKLEAHKKGLLHRAISVIVFNSNGEMLIQKRAASKYHSAGLWTNACCSHPRPEEDTETASKRRLYEEMGINTDLKFAYKFIYRASLDNNLVEHELDHVFTGQFNDAPKINRDEVADWKYVDTKVLIDDVKTNPQSYTHWFQLILKDPRFKF
jgi:isopentenyl-diphosphate Delta-isomerase